MNAKAKVVGIIPARLGSKRVKCKALRMVAGHPLIYYTIRAVQQARTLSAAYVNSESDLIGQVATRYGMPFYKRPPQLATSAALVDELIYEFVTHVPCDVLAVINPTSPLLSSQQIDDAVMHFLAHDCDTQLACEPVQTHCFYRGQPINFSTGGRHPRSQDLEPVMALNSAVILWRTPALIRQFEEKGYAFYTGKIGVYPVEGLAAIDIDYEEDMVLTELVMSNRARFEEAGHAEYDPVLKELIDSGEPTET